MKYPVTVVSGGSRLTHPFLSREFSRYQNLKKRKKLFAVKKPASTGSTCQFPHFLTLTCEISPFLTKINNPSSKPETERMRISLCYFFSILDHKGLSVIAVSASNLTFFTCCNPASRHTIGSLCANNLVKWPDYLTMDSTPKFKATISDYIFSVWCLPLSIYSIFIFMFPSSSTLVFC